MKKRLSGTILGFAVIGMLLSPGFSFYGKGPRPASTNAPGEPSCQASKCHTQFDLNSGGGSLQVEGIPAVYEPGKEYEITISLSQQKQKRWGFQITVLDASHKFVGRLVVKDEKLTKPREAEMDDGSIRYYVEHTLEGSFMGRKNGPVSWKVGWIAPGEKGGPVHFYVAGNAANFNKKPTGDYIYTGIITALDSSPSR